MSRRFPLILAFFVCCVYGQKAATVKDPLNRLDPRSAVTGFLESCHQNNYPKASQYLDLSKVPTRERDQQGPQLARLLESLLNADAQFDPFRLSQDPQGNLGDDSDPKLENVATVSKNGQNFELKLERVSQNGGDVWLFSADTVRLVPKLAPLPSVESVIEAGLPRFLVTYQILETPLWKWIALVLLASIIVGLFRAVSALLLRGIAGRRWHVAEALLEPILVLIAAMLFRASEEFVRPAALTRLRIADFLFLVVVGAIAWALVSLVELFLSRIDAALDPRQRVVSHSLIYLGRRTAKVVIFTIAGLFVLNNWAYHMTTILAGLGVGGIAVALAAQQTIANIFGGVSVIGDHPVMVGDFGNFGGVIGHVADIGFRSTRIRTLARSVVSIPNSSFAGMNLENFSVRDKILFNPTLSVKRGTPKEQILKAIDAIGRIVKEDKRIDPVPTAVRIVALTAAAFSIEIFCYVRTSDGDEFYRIGSDLYLKIDEALGANGVELA